MRWLAQRGGALDYQDWRKIHPGQSFPLAVVIGADPATILGAVTPVPDSLSEYQFAGLLRGAKTELVKCLGSDLQVPASAEIVLEGVITRLSSPIFSSCAMKSRRSWYFIRTPSQKITGTHNQPIGLCLMNGSADVVVGI